MYVFVFNVVFLVVLPILASKMGEKKSWAELQLAGFFLKYTANSKEFDWSLEPIRTSKMQNLKAVNANK